jgi:hypothetical protein
VLNGSRIQDGNSPQVFRKSEFFWIEGRQPVVLATPMKAKKPGREAGLRSWRELHYFGGLNMHEGMA